jgi:hypothetical protein
MLRLALPRPLREWGRSLWQTRRNRIVVIAALALLAVMLVPRPFASAVIYHTVAPDGWHNSTIPGSYNNTETIAISGDVPGLILAYGTIISGNPFNTHFEHVHWRTHDGGQRWEQIAGPCHPDNEHFDFCRLVAPLQGHGTFFASEIHNEFDRPGDLWVSHDAGTSWRFVTHFKDANGEHDAVSALATAVIRGGRLYALRTPDDNTADAPTTFSVSTDDGATWTNPEHAPSALERRGWQIISFAADYSAAHAWYRTLEPLLGQNIVPPTLERSTDDGRTWTTLGSIGTAGSDVQVSLGTSPSQPHRLCAATRPDGGTLAIFSSGDNGHTFAGATTPRVYSGGAPHPISMGTGGDCYLSELTIPPQGTFHPLLLWRLAPGAAHLQQLPSLAEFEWSSTLDGYPFSYVPADAGQPARLVVFVWGHQHPAASWASIFSFWSSEERDNLLVWTPVP